MKALFLLISFATAASSTGQQPFTAGGPTDRSVPLEPRPYAIIERGPHSRVWERVLMQETPFGAQPTVQRYTELQTGMHYLAEGEWVESEEVVESSPNGAVAQRGQHRVAFASDLATSGAITFEAPDGKTIRCSVLGLSFFDKATGKSVMIAEVKSCEGVISGNSVVYEDAFSGIRASVRYTYRKSEFEQDVLLWERLPHGPEDYGLNPETTRLEVLTEFFSPPPATLIPSTVSGSSGLRPDTTVDFGAARISHGKAFSLGAEKRDRDLNIGKEWIKMDGRDFLIEEIPVPDLLKEIESLPPPEGAAIGSNSVKKVASLKRELPLLAAAERKVEMKVASLSLPEKGLVLDFVIPLTGDTNNFVFAREATYHVNGAVNLSGAITWEGGCVIKYSPGSSLRLLAGSSVLWKGDAYLPVVLTARDDDSVGTTITNSTGDPSQTYYANPALELEGGSSSYASFDLSHFRMAFAERGVEVSGSAFDLHLSDGQFVKCRNPIYSGGPGGIHLKNLLLSKFQTAFLLSYVNCSALNVTFDGLPAGPPDYQPSFLFVPTYASNTVTLNLTNSLLANIGMFIQSGTPTLGGSHNGFYNNGESAFGSLPVTSTVNPFTSVAAGNYYLTSTSGFRDAGTANIDAGLLKNLRKQTTFPPNISSNIGFSDTTVVFAPEVPRDTDAIDIGWHAQPIDRIVDMVAFTNTSVILTNGVVLAFYDSSGFLLRSGSAITSTGKPNTPNRLVDYRTVQEQPIKFGASANSGMFPLNGHRLGGTPASARFRFTHFSRLAQAGGMCDLYVNSSWQYSELEVRDCAFFGGQIGLFEGTIPVKFANNVIAGYSGWIYGGFDLQFYNNTVEAPWWEFQCYNSNANAWAVHDNLFLDGFVIEFGDYPIQHHHNAYANCMVWLFNPPGATDQELSALTLNRGLLGNYYLPTGSSLIDSGSHADAADAGFYHYTTRAELVNGKQAKEGHSILDIGHLYIAVDAEGVPLDQDLDGMPDYLEDGNGNGNADQGETSWTEYNSRNGLSSGDGLRVYTPFK